MLSSKPLSLSESCLSAIYHDHQPSWPSAIMTISHHDHQSSWPSAIHPWCQSAISHQDHQPSCNSSMMPICHQTPPLASATLPSCHHVNHPPPSASQKSCPSAIIPKSHYANQPPCPPPFSQYASKPSSASQKSCPSAIILKCHYANQPPWSPPPLQPLCISAIISISHYGYQLYQPLSLLTLALLSRLLSLSACFQKLANLGWKFTFSSQNL